MERVGDRDGKIERYFSTGQSPQRAVASTEEEELHLVGFNTQTSECSLVAC
jgi:hypothetical protein